VKRIDVPDYLAIAEMHLDVAAETLLRVVKLGALESALAAPFAGFGEEDLYAELHVKAAVLCSRLMRNHRYPTATSGRRTHR